MKKYVCLAFLLLAFAMGKAQVKVTFILKETTSITHDSIYITGSFNNWDSTPNRAYLLKPLTAGEKAITVFVQHGELGYKFHRGSWLSVEKTFDSYEVSDRIVLITKDTVLRDVVSAWRDEFFIDKWQTIAHSLSDTAKLATMASLANTYAFNLDHYNGDSAFYYARQSLQLLQQMKTSDSYKKWFAEGNSGIALYMQETIAALLYTLGNYPKSLEIRLENIKLAEKEKDKFLLAEALNMIVDDYDAMKDYPNMLAYAKRSDSVLKLLDKKDRRFARADFFSKYHLARAYNNTGRYSDALMYARQSTNIYTGERNWDFSLAQLLLAEIFINMNQLDSALHIYRRMQGQLAQWGAPYIARAEAGMARVFQKTNQIDSALFYARKSLHYFQTTDIAIRAWGFNSTYYMAEISPLVAELYQQKNMPDSAYKYLQLSYALKDSLYNTEKIRQFQTLNFNEATRKQQLEQQSREEKRRYETKIKMYGLIGIITGVAILALILYRNNRQKQKANVMLETQKQEIEATLGELKNTQRQLIQSEKMASLGELTAGIAHEIQNPLNFVNNFSEVSYEMLDEMNAALNKGDIDDARATAAEVKQNLEKINHHGKRAAAIVKGMLQHSRQSSGKKELTDINALCDEYLRLSYHGLRAKDKSFNAKFETDFDPAVEKINVIPQELGRVILNLVNNAFYAVSEKRKENETGYEPTVLVSTKKMENKNEITVQDNGAGIPKSIIDKIFQPFFTTKPTGSGTGLGLSLSYDIVKAHGGELKAESQEGEFTRFIINLPL